MFRFKEKKFRRCTSELKPSLTHENIKQHVGYCLGNIEPASLPHDPTFKGAFNVVHSDEKWFYRTVKTQNVYLDNAEEPPKREVRTRVTFKNSCSYRLWQDHGMICMVIVHLMAR